MEIVVDVLLERSHQGYSLVTVSFAKNVVSLHPIFIADELDNTEDRTDGLRLANIVFGVSPESNAVKRFLTKFLRYHFNSFLGFYYRPGLSREKRKPALASPLLKNACASVYGDWCPVRATVPPNIRGLQSLDK